ncbi:GTP-binding protein TypA, related, related [Eimeria brunetti]|uniref:GTP-binding protein TypA, related, related n=1 Tax=Eimeria brunetti TaxID=51314 RepID=U6L977_9EIME|nr:GTP-binding protein TypA, related, related [Eimeria brunetti]
MTEVSWHDLDLLEAYEHKIYSRVRHTGTSVLLRLQNGEDPRTVFTPSGLPRSPPYPLCCKLSDLGELGPGIPLLFQFIKFLLLSSALNGLLSLAVSIAVYSHKAADAHTNCSTFNRVLLTAGCVEEKASESRIPAVTHLVMEHLTKTAGKQVYQLRDFALLLDGFPADAIDEEEIASFFCRSVLPNQPPESVVKVVIGFDARHYDEHVKLHESLKERLDILKALLWAAALGLCTASFCIAGMLIILNISLKNKDFTGTGIGLIKLVEDWIMSVNGSAIQDALSNPVGDNPPPATKTAGCII